MNSAFIAALKDMVIRKMFKLVIFTSCCKIQETEAEAVRFGLRFLYFAAGRENNQLEHFSDDRITTPPTEQGFLEFKESKTRLLHGNKLRQQIVGDYLKADFAPLKNWIECGNRNGWPRPPHKAFFSTLQPVSELGYVP